MQKLRHLDRGREIDTATEREPRPHGDTNRQTQTQRDKNRQTNSEACLCGKILMLFFN